MTFDKRREEVFIPNLEVAQEFLNAVDDPGWGGVVQSLKRSENLLKPIKGMWSNNIVSLLSC